MNGKYMRQAEMRWTSHDAKRLEHIREKREKKAKKRELENVEFFKVLELIANTKLQRKK